jgi:hypothetical protein
MPAAATVLTVIIVSLCAYPAQSQRDSKATVPKCSANQVLVQARERIWANGCGTASVKVDHDPVVVPCCNFHDTCYSICGMTHKECESKFKKCIAKSCAGDESCQNRHNMLTMGTSMFGQSIFEESQSTYCECVQSNLTSTVYMQRSLEVYKFAGLKPKEASSKTEALQRRIDAFAKSSRPAREGGAKLLMDLYEKYPSAIDVRKRDSTHGGDL